MRLPGAIPAGKESKARVESIDIFPTITEFAGLPTPQTVQGRSLVPILTGKKEQHRDAVHSEYLNTPLSKPPVKNMTMMLFDGRYKLVDNGPEIPPELYDQHSDPLEITNIQAQPEQKERMEKMLAEVRTWGKSDLPLRSPKNDE